MMFCSATGFAVQLSQSNMAHVSSGATLYNFFFQIETPFWGGVRCVEILKQAMLKPQEKERSTSTTRAVIEAYHQHFSSEVFSV